MGRSKKKLKLSDKVGLRKGFGFGKNVSAGAGRKTRPITSGSGGSKGEPKVGKTKGDNPFELKFNKQKHSVMGRAKTHKSASVRVGKPGFSKKQALERRKETLLGEFHRFNKSNRLVDRRLDEKNPGLSREEKAARRLTVERQKVLKKRGVYRLNEEEDEDREDPLTHGGHDLADELTDRPIGDYGEDIEMMDEEFVSRVHFGGGEDVEEGGKGRPRPSRKDLINDLISESKKLRHQKQVQKARQEDLTGNLDAQWKEVMEENLIGKLMPSGKEGGGKDEREDIHGDYDTIFNSLKFERHSVKATDRLETPEEVAKKEKAKLERLERERVERMKVVQKGPRIHISADDDVSGNLDLESWSSRRSRNRETLAYKDGKLVGQNGREEEELSDMSDPSDLDINEEEELDDEVDCSDNATTKTNTTYNSSSEIPFVFEMPGSFTELVGLLRGHSAESQSLIMERLIKCHHPSLKEGNKQKLRRLFVYFLRYFGISC